MSLNLDKNNLHHAYLLEGVRDEILAELFEFLESAGLKTKGNAEFLHMHIDAFKMEDARNLKVFAREKSFSLGRPGTGGAAGKKIFVISTNSILLEAQGSLLKIFEEPIPDTHFFLIIPDTNSLLKTLLSRFYVIRRERATGSALAEKFIVMRPAERIEYIKELIAEKDEENVAADSARTEALKFLNSLEAALHNKSTIENFPKDSFEHFFKVRQFLRMPGSSVKSLMESVALIIPVI